MEAKEGEGQGEYSTGCCFSESSAQMSLPQEGFQEHASAKEVSHAGI